MNSHLSIKTPASASSFSTPKSRDVQQKLIYARKGLYEGGILSNWGRVGGKSVSNQKENF